MCKVDVFCLVKFVIAQKLPFINKSFFCFCLKYFKNLKPETYMDCRFTFKNGAPESAELGDNYMATLMYRNCQPEVRFISRHGHPNLTLQEFSTNESNI